MSPDIANVPGGEEDRITLPRPFESTILGRGNTKHKDPEKKTSVAWAKAWRETREGMSRVDSA